MRRISIRIEDDKFNKFKNYCKDKDTSMNKSLNRLIDNITTKYQKEVNNKSYDE